MRKTAGANMRGFTMIEVVAVLLLIGILAAVAIPMLTSTGSYSLASETEILKTHLRFAQIKAMSDVPDNTSPNLPNTWGITVAGGSYKLQKNGVDTTVKLPGEDLPTHTFSGSITASPASISFDSWGSPTTGPITITLSSGGQTRAITVTKNTGFIP